MPAGDYAYWEAQQDPFHPRFWPEKLYQISEARKGGKGIFLCNMSDLFGLGIPEEWTRLVLNAIRMGPENNRYYLLTKQPQNLAKFSPFPKNCWVGVSASDSRMFIRALEQLSRIEATIKYVSIEPLLDWQSVTSGIWQVVDWLIIGAMTCSGGDLSALSAEYPALLPMPYGNRYTLQPEIEQVEEIVKAADKASTPVFLKDNLGPLIFDYPWAEGLLTWDGELRQELPK
jgi:hypothetical protein